MLIFGKFDVLGFRVDMVAKNIRRKAWEDTIYSRWHLGIKISKLLDLELQTNEVVLRPNLLECGTFPRCFIWEIKSLLH